VINNINNVTINNNITNNFRTNRAVVSTRQPDPPAIRGRPTVTPLNGLSNNGQRLTKVSASEMAQHQKDIRQFQDLSRHRSEVERSNVGRHAASAGHSEAGTHASLKLPLESHGLVSLGSSGRPASELAPTRNRGTVGQTRSPAEPSHFTTSRRSHSSWAESSGARTIGSELRSHSRLPPSPSSSARGSSIFHPGQMAHQRAGSFSPTWGSHYAGSSFSSPRSSPRPSFSGRHSSAGMHSSGDGHGGGGHHR
jgi:hypothetical protein